MTAPEHATAPSPTHRGPAPSAAPPSSSAPSSPGATAFQPDIASSYLEGRDARLRAAATTVATWSLRFLLVVAAAVVLGWIIARLWVIVLPVLLGVLLATVLWPAARWLRRFMPDALAALLVLLAGLGVLTGLGVWLVPQIADQADELADAASGGLEDLQGLVTGPPFNLGESQVGAYVDQAVEWLQGNAQTIAGSVLSGVSALGSLLVGTLLAVVMCFFVLKDGPRFLPWISAWTGPRAAPHAVEVARRCWTTLSGFIRAQAIVGLVDAVAIGTGLVVLGVPLALPLAVLTFFGAFVPIIGATVTGILAALVALVSNGPTAAIIVVVLVLIVQQLEGNVLQPILVGNTLDLHPILVILGVTAGGSLFGIVGAFLAVPTVAVGTALVRYGRERLDGPDAPHHLTPPPPPPPVTSDATA